MRPCIECDLFSIGRNCRRTTGGASFEQKKRFPVSSIFVQREEFVRRFRSKREFFDVKLSVAIDVKSPEIDQVQQRKHPLFEAKILQGKSVVTVLVIQLVVPWQDGVGLERQAIFRQRKLAIIIQIKTRKGKSGQMALPFRGSANEFFRGQKGVKVLVHIAEFHDRIIHSSKAQLAPFFKRQEIVAICVDGIKLSLCPLARERPLHELGLFQLPIPIQINIHEQHKVHDAPIRFTEHFPVNFSDAE